MSRWLLVCSCLVGCARPAAASLVPQLALGLRAVRTQADGITREGDRLAVAALVTLSFRPRTEAAALPARGEASALSAASPCADDDAACLDEVGEVEREFAGLVEDVP